MKLLGTSERLAVNRFITDEDESHISLDRGSARSTGMAERLIAVCPAGVYRIAQDGTVTIEYAACLECGTCRAVDTEGVLHWRYPKGGFGVQYREG